MKTMHNTLRFFTLLLMLALVGCGASVPTIKPYKMDIQQGNVVTSEMLLKLRPGMSKSQVQFIMGTPLLVDSFHSDRWDYFYQFRKDGKIINQHRVILEFNGDSLTRVRGDVVPEGTDIDALMKGESGEKLENKVVEPEAPASMKEGHTDVIATPIEEPAIESNAMVVEPVKEDVKPLTEAVDTSIKAEPVVEKADVTVESTQEKVEAVVEDAQVEPVMEAPVEERLIEPPVVTAPEVSLPKVEAEILPEPAKVEEPVVVAPAEINPVEDVVESVKAEVAPVVEVEQVEVPTPAVAEKAPKVISAPKQSMIPAPPVIESSSKTISTPKQSMIPAPPTVGKATKSGIANSSTKAKQSEATKQHEYKPGEDLLPYEEDTSFFERALEAIGF
jgi:outer membrane protein assembly factor BamE